MKLYGINPVVERLRTNPKSITKILIEQGHKEWAYIQRKAKKWGIPVFAVPSTKIDKMARSRNAQGIVVDIEPFSYMNFEDLLEMAVGKKHTLVFLDGLKDPQNLGGLIRSLACLGQFAVVLPTHESVEVTEAVLRVASGGENYIPVAKIGNIIRAIAAAQEAGFQVWGTTVEGGSSLYETKFSFPMGIVIGSEEKGVRDIVQKKVDFKVTIPMAHQTMSFNAAHAATVFCYEIARQKRTNK